MTIVQRKNKPPASDTTTSSSASAIFSDHHVCAFTTTSINLGGDNIGILQMNKAATTGVDHSPGKKRVPILIMVMSVVAFISILLLVYIFSMSVFLGNVAADNNNMMYDWGAVDSMKHKPRLVFLSMNRMNDQNSSSFSVDPILHVSAGEESVEQSDEGGNDHDQSNCVPMASWQTKSYPTCNAVHEINMEDFGHYPLLQSQIGYRRINIGPYSVIADGVPYSYTNIKFMGKGWYRQTWKVDSLLENFVLKTLRFDRDFLKEYYESHRKDAMASEKLSSSPYVIDIYAYCAQSVINEYAAFKEGISKLKDFILHIKKLKGKNILKLKLKIAHMIAQGVQHIHDIDGPNTTTLVHYDLNPSNVLITMKGVPKINDFNVAHFFYWDTLKQERCPFVGYLTSQPWWRAPEEMDERPNIDEKVDIYSLGNILFNILVGHSPRRPSRNETGWIEKVRTDVKAGIPPKFSDDDFSKEPDIVAIVEAISRCYELDPRKRSSARDIVSILEQAALHA